MSRRFGAFILDTSYRVYLNVNEPPAFYWDLLFVTFCAGVAISIASALLHSSKVARA